jgi:uncharacterized OB-fold protein
MTDPIRPAPILTEDNNEFWMAAAEGRLVAQRCRACGELRHPPRPMCPLCHSIEYDPVELSGNGVVYSYSILHYPQFPTFDYPIVAVLVDLEEGVRLLSELRGVGHDDVQIGLHVEVRFEDTSDGMAVPVFVQRNGT